MCSKESSGFRCLLYLLIQLRQKLGHSVKCKSKHKAVICKQIVVTMGLEHVIEPVFSKDGEPHPTSPPVVTCGWLNIPQQLPLSQLD